jgi:acetylornithine/N-succinyldiaminopimelate aminotransferase
VLLIYDEIQCGAGRTGKLFHHQWVDGGAPDLLAAAKGIGGGFPMGMILATAEAASGMAKGVHGTTFGGGPLAMAVGNAVLDVVAGDGFLEQVRRVAGTMQQGWRV